MGLVKYIKRGNENYKRKNPAIKSSFEVFLYPKLQGNNSLSDCP